MILLVEIVQQKVVNEQPPLDISIFVVSLRDFNLHEICGFNHMIFKKDCQHPNEIIRYDKKRDTYVGLY